jgi:integrase
MAHAVLAYTRRIMSWHATRDDDFANPIVRGMGRVKPSETARKRILSDDELRAIWKATERPDVYGNLIRFLLLTSARNSEARELRWDELEAGNWTLPAARNKTKLDLVRPLSAAAMEVLNAQRELRIGDCAYVFSTTGNLPIFSMAERKRALDAASGVTGWTIHDLRRTARSLMSRAGVNADHAERCLGHVIGGVRGVYDRHEYEKEKRHAFEALAAEIATITRPPGGKVTPFRRPGRTRG